MSKSRTVTVTDEATRLDTEAGGRVALGQSLSGRVRSGASIFLGGEDVTPAAGTEVKIDEWLPGVDLATDDSLWAICDTGETAVVNVFETGVG